jgi:hypothetical protein
MKEENLHVLMYRARLTAGCWLAARARQKRLVDESLHPPDRFISANMRGNAMDEK